MSKFNELIEMAMEPLRFAAEIKTQQQLARYPLGYQFYTPPNEGRIAGSKNPDITNPGKFIIAAGLGVAVSTPAVEAIFDFSDALSANGIAIGVGGIAIGGFINAHNKKT